MTYINECSHLDEAFDFRFESINGTAWKKIKDSNFVGTRIICTQCGKTLRIKIRNKTRGLRIAVEFL